MAWDAAPTATSYQVQSQTPAATVTVAGTTHTESGLPQATTFNWRVAACNAAGCSTPTSYSPMTTGGSLTHVATSNNSSQNSLTDTVNTVHNWTVPAGGGSAGSVSGAGFPLGGAGGNGPGGSPGGGGGWASACGGPCGGWTYQNGNAGAGFDGAAARPWAGAGGGGTGPGGGGAVIYATVFGTGAGGGGGGGHGRTAVVGYTSSNLTSGTAGSVSNGSVTICWHGSTACGTTPVFLP
jgi:hypothetical protein